MTVDLARYGPWALIVGGSEGMGADYARLLAAEGFALVLVARKPEPLAALKAELEQAGATVETCCADLAAPDALEQVRKHTDGREIGLMIFNAGANAVRGRFTELDAEVTRTVFAVTITGQSEFARHYGALMCERGRGGMILTGSIAGFLGSPELAAYCSAKAFSRVLAEALWAECKPLGVDVLHPIMSLTATPAMARLGLDLSAALSSREVAAEALAHLADGPLRIMDGERGMAAAEAMTTLRDRAALIGALAVPPRPMGS